MSGFSYAAVTQLAEWLSYTQLAAGSNPAGSTDDEKRVLPMLVPVVDLKGTGWNIAALRKERGISVRELQQIHY